MRRYRLAFAVVIALATTNAFSQTTTATPTSSGGGWFPAGVVFFPTFGEQEANFGYSARVGPNGFQGHLNYHNRTTGLTVNGPVTNVESSNCFGLGPSVILSGTATDGSNFFFEVMDNGEPGKGNDRICKFTVSRATAAAPPDTNTNVLLTGGNIQSRF